MDNSLSIFLVIFVNNIVIFELGRMYERTLYKYK